MLCWSWKDNLSIMHKYDWALHWIFIAPAQAKKGYLCPYVWKSIFHTMDKLTDCLCLGKAKVCRGRGIRSNETPRTPATWAKEGTAAPPWATGVICLMIMPTPNKKGKAKVGTLELDAGALDSTSRYFAHCIPRLPAFFEIIVYTATARNTPYT